MEGCYNEFTIMSYQAKTALLALILDRLLTFLVAFFALVLKPFFSQSLSVHIHLSFGQDHLLESDHHSVFGWQCW